MAAQAEASPAARRFAQAETDLIWLGPTQQAGVAHLCAETQIRALIGPASSGKTTLLRHFPQHPDDALPLHVPGPYATESELLSGLLAAASLEVAELTKHEQRNLLRVFVEQRGVGSRIIVCADNVAGYSTAAWNEIQWLMSLKAGNKPLVELAIVCTDEEASSSPLSKVMQSSATSAVEAVRYLAPPSADDIRRYIAWRLERIDADITFSEDACRRISQLCKSRFATVNLLCEAILSAQRRHGGKTIDVDTVNLVAGLARPGAAIKRPVAAKPLPLSVDEILPDRLVISRNGKIERIVGLDRRLVIGRSETADLRLDGRYLSRHHAMILPAGDDKHYAIVDLNSVSGVFVNGERIKRHVLCNGDIVELGLYRLKVIATGDGRRDSTDAVVAPESQQATEAAARPLAPAV